MMRLFELEPASPIPHKPLQEFVTSLFFKAHFNGVFTTSYIAVSTFELFSPTATTYLPLGDQSIAFASPPGKIPVSLLISTFGFEAEALNSNISNWLADPFPLANIYLPLGDHFTDITVVVAEGSNAASASRGVMVVFPSKERTWVCL